MMFVVLAYAHDAGARALVQRWCADGEDAALLTCVDLSRPGWRYTGGVAHGQAVIDGQLIATREVRAVITRIPAVSEAELANVHEDDRRYAAAEMQAFLLAWLTSLECPVLNRPTPSNLGGPSWSVAQWVQTARRLGLAARPVRQRLVYAPGVPYGIDCRIDPSAVFVDVVGERAFLVSGRAPRAHEGWFVQAAIALARNAGAELLRVYFEHGSEQRPVFLEAALWIDIAAESVAEALIDRCRSLVHAPSESRSPRMLASAEASA
jgi:hypothetical protein